MRPHSKQQGYILLPVVLIITLVAIVAFMMTVESTLETGTSGGERQTDQVRYVAEAGLNHAQWQVEQAGCGPYTDITGEVFGDQSYSADITLHPVGGTVTTFSIPASDDAYIKMSTPTQNYSSDAQLPVVGDLIEEQRTLYRFDLTAAGIPGGATVMSAVVKLFMIDSNDLFAVNLHRVNEDWNEATVTWDSINDKFDAAVLASISQGATAGEYVSFNTTSLVQGWVNGSQANQGIMLQSAGILDLSQYTSKEYGNADQRPFLEVKVVDGSLATRADIRATGILANGMEQTLTRGDVVLYQPPLELTWQPGPALEDASIWGGMYQAYNFGASPVLNIKNDRNVLIRFPIEALPPGSRVVDARLELYLAGGSGVVDGQLDLHRVNRPWVEGQHDNVIPLPGEGVSYLKYDGLGTWDTLGGDYDAPVIDRVTLPSMVPGWYTWSVTDQVQAWVDGQAHFGFLLREGGGDAGDIDFVSSDDAAQPQYHPRLTIRIACECGQACLAPQGSGNILVVVDDPDDLAAGEAVILRLFTAWGYDHSLIKDDKSQDDFDTAMATHDVVFVSGSAEPDKVGTKLTNASIGVVCAANALNDELGISTDAAKGVGQTIIVTDTSHEITQIFPAGSLVFKQVDTALNLVGGTLAPGVQVLAEFGGAGALVVLEDGADLAGGGTAAGRRVMLPLGSADYNPYLTNNGQLIIQRAIEWAKPISCSDGDYRDDFESEAFSNNDGSLTWGSDWVEVDGEGAGPATGNVIIRSGLLVLDDNPDTGGQPSAARTLNLQGANRALLDLDFELGNKTDETDDVAILEISIDGSTWDVLEDFSVFDGGDTGHRTYDLSDYLSADVQIRFRIEAGYGSDDENLQIDNLVVSVCGTLEEPATTGLIAHWPLDETSGLKAEDIAGGHDGNLIDGPVWTPGQIEGSLSLDGSGDYISVPHQDTLSLKNFTISAWVRPAALNGWRVVVAKGTAADLNYYLGTHENEISMGFLNVGVWTEFETTGAGLAVNNWYHLAGTFDDAIGEVKMYLNGVLLHTATTTASPPACNDDLMIGTDVFDEFWSGLLDDVRIYDRVLDSTAIADLVEAGSPIPADAEYVDTFNTVAFNGSDGTRDWSTSPWEEISDDNAPDSGNVRVTGGRLVIDNQDGGTYEGVMRGADLSIGNPATAVLSFDYAGFGAGGNDIIVLSVSDDGGSSWTYLENITVTGDVTGSRSYNLHDAIALTSDFQLRVEVLQGFDSAGQFFFLDNVVIDLHEVGIGPTGTYKDAFNDRTFSGNDGSLYWINDWREDGESDGALTGDIGVGTDMSDFQLRLKDNDNGGEGVTRGANLAGVGSVQLAFSYRRQDLDSIDDYVKVEISANGAPGPWTEIVRFEGPGTDANYQSYAHDISSYAASKTAIRFITSPSMGDLDIVWIDDVEISCSP